MFVFKYPACIIASEHPPLAPVFVFWVGLHLHIFSFQFFLFTVFYPPLTFGTLPPFLKK